MSAIIKPAGLDQKAEFLASLSDDGSVSHSEAEYLFQFDTSKIAEYLGNGSIEAGTPLIGRVSRHRLKQALVFELNHYPHLAQYVQDSVASVFFDLERAELERNLASQRAYTLQATNDRYTDLMAEMQRKIQELQEQNETLKDQLHGVDQLSGLLQNL